MYYVNFEDHITVPYRVVLEGWPVDDFKSPSAFKCLNTVTVIYNCFQSGAAKFRRLSDVEYDKWHAKWLQSKVPGPSNDTDDDTDDEQQPAATAVEPSTSAAEATQSTPVDAAPSQPTGSKKRKAVTGTSSNKKARLPMTTDSVNSITGPSGAPVEAKSATRKERKDKGVKRGPYKKRNQSGTDATVAAPKKKTPAKKSSHNAISSSAPAAATS